MGGSLRRAKQSFERRFIPEFKPPKSEADQALAESLRAQAVRARTANADLSAENITNIEVGGTAQQSRRRRSGGGTGGDLATALGIT